MSPGQSQHVELKYLFASRERETVLAWLDHACLRDPRFPCSTVSSIYFDTPSLALYEEKQNGDYLHAKVRLRWYHDEGDGPPGLLVPCFLEIKSKEGSMSRKRRHELRFPLALLDGDPLSDVTITNLAVRVGELGYSPPGVMVPTLLVRYRRHRFLDPRSLARLAVDTDIRCTRANPAFVPGWPPVHLNEGVLEVKGGTARAPGALGFLGSRLDRESFSKYTACIDRLGRPS